MPAAGEVRLCAPARRANLLPLVCSPACPDLGCLPTMLYACVSGALGVVVSLPREQYLLLERLQVGAGRRVRFGCTCVRAHRREGGGGRTGRAQGEVEGTGEVDGELEEASQRGFDACTSRDLHGVIDSSKPSHLVLHKLLLHQQPVLDTLQLEQAQLALGRGRDGRQLGAEAAGAAAPPLLLAHARRRRGRLIFLLLLLQGLQQCGVLCTQQSPGGGVQASQPVARRRRRRRRVGAASLAVARIAEGHAL